MSVNEEEKKVDDSSRHGSEEDFSSRHEAVLPPFKPKDPRSKAKYNIFSRILFLWVDALFCLGCRGNLDHSDLYAHPSEADSEKLQRKFDRFWLQELERRNRGLKPRLWITMLKSFWWRLILHGLLTFLEVLGMLGQSIILGYLARYFSLPCDLRNDEETRNAYLYATGLVTLAILIALIHAHGFLTGQKIGMLTRIMMTSAIHKKVLNLSQVTIGRISIGHIVNLASNDVQRFDLAFLFLPYFWIAPIHVIIATYLIYREVGWVCFVVMVFIVFQVPFQIFIAKLFGKKRLKSAKLTDKRIRIMNEVITGIRVIKMYAWEYAFKRVVTAIRKRESQLIREGGIIRSLASSFIFGGVMPIMMGLTFLVFVVSGGELTSQRVFTTLSIVNPLRRTSIAFIVRSFFLFYETRVALKRIQDFLLLDEVSSPIKNSLSNGTTEKVSFNAQVSNEGYFRPDSPWLPGTTRVNLDKDSIELRAYNKTHSSADGFKQASIFVNNILASWTNDRDKPVLRRINFEVDSTAPLLGIVGPVGSGKSTLLQCLLGELNPLEGTIKMNGHVSYTSQDPWVFTGTLRENILFGLPYQRERYNEVIEVCALTKDMESLVNGDLTLVGERGVTLSGGQKARVSLARAIYHDADIYLLDDPLSAVDAAVGKHLFEECIRGVLKDKLVILVTHQVHFALQTDKLLVLKDGEVQIYGTHSELLERNIDTVRLLGMIQDEEKEQDEFVYKDEKCNNSENDAYTFHRMVSEEDSKSPRHRKRVTIEEPDQTSLHSAASMMSLDAETETSKHENEFFHRPSLAPPAEEKAHGSISMKTYFRFFRAGGNYVALLLMVIFLLIGEASIVITDWWLSDWAGCDESARNRMQSSDTNGNFSCLEDVDTSTSQTCSVSENIRLIIYAVLVVLAVVLNLIRGGFFYLICVNASRVLHNRMFASALRTPVLFYDTNPSGRVLNRFSKDMGFLDDLLPQTFLEYLILLIRFIAILTIAAAGNPYILIPLPIILIIFIAIRWYFLKTSRDVKRLEAIARSPVYSHISTTLQGLSIIRTFGKQEISVKHLHTFNDQHTQGWYMYLVMTRWFGLRLDFLSTVILIAVTFMSIPLISLADVQLDPALLGLGLTYTISLAGMFQYCVRQSTEVENIMISTERIMSYIRLEPEASLETISPNKKPPQDWPDKGELHLEDVAFRYSPELPMVLRNLNFSIRPAEKIGIVGRTGAGKSSLLSVLYRLAEPFGQIAIDGVDTKSIGLHDLRKKMSIIPQDPVLFSGSMRYNLDPFDEYSDAELWEVLEQVQLKEAVKEMEGQLSGEVSEGGSNFSVGQRQLVCLARALLRKNKILILDEATANVDPKTDDIIQEAIRDRFVGCTVLTIAHRLNTIMDSDRILVMSKGQVKEFASPHQLLQNPSSLLFKMVEKTGPEASRKLHQMALDAHSRAHRKQN